jgi:sigma-B regulation protein RsbU (phosphoserine phosphatase)
MADFPVDTEVLRAAFDHLNVGVYVTDLERRIVLWNRKAEEITGYPAEDIVGKACHENVLVHADKDGHELCHSGHCPLYRSMQVGESSDVPVIVFALNAAHRRVAVSVSVAPLRDASGEIVGGIEIFRDESAQLRDLEFAQKIQRNVLPDLLPEPEGLRFDVRYYPHDLVGGDFYDVREMDEGRYGVLLADVSGHGVSAALYTMQLRSIAGGSAMVAGDPAAFIGAVNDELAKYVLAESFATAFYAVVDSHSGAVTYASAGHPPALHLAGAGGEVTKLEAKGAPLGIIEEYEYENSVAELAPGDILLTYTDGATEVPDGQGRFLGEEGLARLLTEEWRKGRRLLLERIYEQVKEACGSVSPPDDITLLSATYLG